MTMNLTAPNQHALRFRYLSLWNGSRWVLRNVNLELPQGSFCVLLGANGAGKSSFLKLIAGVLQAPWLSSGQFEQQPGHEGYATSSWLSQHMTVSEDTSVREFLDLASEQGSVLSEPGLVRDFELEELLSHRLSTLSGGQWQRVRLAQVLARRSMLLLLDEPDTGLDVRWRTVLWQWLAEKSRLGVTIIVAAHRFIEMTAFATHWLGFEDGQLVFFAAQPGSIPQPYVDRLFFEKFLTPPFR